MDITKEPSKILKQKLTEVKEITPAIKALISAMRVKMVEAKGVGLAANQVGEDLQIFVIDKTLADENGPTPTLIPRLPSTRARRVN